MKLDIINDNMNLKIISQVLGTYKDVTINKELQLTERTFIRENGRIESEKIQAIKEMYDKSVDVSLQEKSEILKIVRELLSKDKIDTNNLSACNILLKFRELNSSEHINMKSKQYALTSPLETLEYK